jgi:hypothetical protein
VKQAPELGDISKNVSVSVLYDSIVNYVLSGFLNYFYRLMLPLSPYISKENHNAEVILGKISGIEDFLYVSMVAQTFYQRDFCVSEIHRIKDHDT